MEGPHGVLVELAAFFGEDQLLEAGVLLHAPAGDVALALHELQDVGDSGTGDGELPLDVPLEHWGLGVPVKILHDPAVHGGHGLHAIGAGDLAYLAENKVVHPAQLGRDDLRRLPRRRDGPICFGKIKRAWKIYLCGFGFALFIEVVQLITGRGVFETDDIINNTIGAMIGYGLFSVARLIFVAVCSRKKVQDNTNEVSGVAHDENVCERQNISIRKCLVAQLPLAFTIIAFAAVFIVYNSMEYGNLSIDNISNQNVDVSMADGVSLADEADPLDVYTIHRATEDEARELADGYFSKYGVLIDDSKTDIYDDTIIFYSTSLDDEGSNLSIWCDYEGPTVSFTDFSNIDDENSYADAGLSEEFVREKLENLGVVIPENAVFAPIEEYDAGNYRFTNDGEILDDGLYYKGTIECCINSSGKIANFRDSMIKYTPYKKVDVISEKEAYDRLCAGKFYFPDYDKDEQLSDLVVKSVKISYTPDSKGYYRPVYEFVANANQDTGKREISIMVDAMEI